MTILIANIGTSDLAVKIDEYYLPIGFDRNEPNLDKAMAELSHEEKAIWGTCKVKVDEFFKKLIPDLEKTSFRERTCYLLEEYQKDPDTWHSRLSPGRLWGVMEAAIREEQVTKIYMFVTDQPQFEGETSQENRGYPTDSIHLFDILKHWFYQKYGDKFEMIPVIIPKTLPAVDQDGLLNEYYDFFNQFDKSIKVLVSVKGGTPQMQTALRVQAMSSDITNQIYLEPALSIKGLLAGEPSNCQKISYWRYQRTQKYQTVKQLLNRWDFDGARTILTQWRETLTSLKKEGIDGIQDIKVSENRINSIIKALNMAVGYLNLDTAEAERQTTLSKDEVENQETIDALSKIADLSKEYNSNKFSPLLNLYTQCCVFDTLDRMADFLTRMGSFYEETLHELIRAFDGEQYFERDNNPDDWHLDTEKLLGNQALLDNFYELEKKINRTFRNWRRINPMDDPYRLQGRLSKSNFVQALVRTENGNLVACQTLVDAITKLDYWAEKRNQLIHSAKGVSKQRMKEVRQEDYQLWQDGKMRNQKIARTVGRSCLHDQILTQLEAIAGSTLTLMETTQPPSAMYPNPADYLDPNQEPYYLYSDIRKWVIDTLNNDV
jgi:hypothetical protein